MTQVQESVEFQLLGRRITAERRLAASGEGTLIVTGEDERPRAYHSRIDPRREARQQLASRKTGDEAQVLWVFLGIGLGYILEELNDAPAQGVVYVECDAQLVNGNEKIKLTENFHGLVGLSKDQVLENIERLRREKHCTSVQVWVNPAALTSFPSYYQPLLTALEAQSQALKPFPFRFSVREKRREGCYLIVDTGYFMIRELAQALQAEGHIVMVLRMPLKSESATPDATRYGDFLRSLVEAIEHLQPDALITINHLGFDREGILTELLARMKMPALIWYVDSPRYIFQNPEGNVSSWVGTFVWDRSYVSWLRWVGFDNVHYLPLGTDAQIFGQLSTTDRSTRARKTPSSGPLVFVGDSMAATVQKAITKLPPDIARYFEANAEGHFPPWVEAFITRCTTEPQSQRCPPWKIFQELWETETDSLGEVRRSVARESETYLNLESALTLFATRQRRVEWIQALSRMGSPQDLLIYGDSNWEKYLTPENRSLFSVPRLKPAADYYRELPGVYRQAGAVLNLTSLQMPHGLNQRCYDVPAAGGFLLTDQQPALAEQFDLDREVVSFTSRDELRDKWTYYREHAQQRQEIINRGRRRVLQEHTYRQRLQEMLKTARSWFS